VKLRDQRQIGDFRKWKDQDAYQQAFDRVLRDPEGDVRRRGNPSSGFS
jgi:hypothetical protein